MASNGWDQPVPTGYAPATFRNGNMAHLAPSHETDVSYLLRGDGSVHHSRSQYGHDYHSNNSHLGQNLHAGLHAPAPNIEEHYWPHQHDPSHDAPTQHALPQNEGVHDDNNHQDSANDNLSDDEAPATSGPARPAKTVIPRSERRKHYKPKPEPSNPRLFRPFAPNETKDTMLAQWRTPPVVGSYIMFPNKRLKYNPVPPDIDEVREKLFKMEDSVLLKNSQEVADYVPHITNFWRRAVQRHEIDEETGVQYEHWHCRSKKVKKPPRRPESTAKGVRNREKKSVIMFEDKELCRMRIRVTSFTKHADNSDNHERWGGGACRCVAEWVHFERDCIDDDLKEHTHDQLIMEEWKNSEAIGILAKIKCEEGNSYSAVAKWMRKEYGDVNKQVHAFVKGSVANAAQLWRNDHKDLVLREEVPEDSEEMTTMRRCVDAMLEADADALRAALREICKDSDALTKTTLAILEKHKKDKPAVPEPETPEEPWKLTEGVTLLGLPPPGASRRLQENSGVNGPLLIPWEPIRPEYANSVQRYNPDPRMVRAPPIGPDGRPVVVSQAPSTRAPNTPQGNAHAPGPQPHVQQQYHFQPPVGVPAGRGTQLQPRPPPPPPGYQQHPPQVEIRYIQPPPGPPQRGSMHPITVSIEVPSCALDTCKQCKDMRRSLAGRTFFFQDRLHTSSHFSKLQRLLRDPRQLLDDDYLRMLHQSEVPRIHQHPALHPRPVGGSAIGSVDQMPQLQGAPASGPIVGHGEGGPGLNPPHASPKPSAALPGNPTEPKDGASTSSNGASGSAPRAAQPASSSIYDKPLPVPITIEDIDDDDDDEDGEGEGEGDEEGDGEPPAKRQRKESTES